MQTSSSEALSYTWERFAHAVRTTHRFTFFRIHDDGEEEFSVAGLLDALKKIFEASEPWKTFPTGFPIHRAHIAPESKTGKRLGTSPSKFAKANRMSPDGIGMFYGAFEIETCINEIVRGMPEGTYSCSIGTFSTKSSITLLDLTGLREGSVFGEPESYLRQINRFLNHFQREISRPADSAANAAVEYAHTQILTEYFRHSSLVKLGRPADGIIYNSATTPGRSCVVLFVSHEQCGDPGDPDIRLELVRWEDRSVRLTTTVHH